MSYLKIPFFKQDTSYTCGAASLQMVLSFFKRFESERHLAIELKTNTQVGTRHRNLIETVSQKGLYSYVNDHSCIEEIKYFLNRKLPIIVHFIESGAFEKVGHYSVVTKCNNKYIYLNDPWSGRNQKYKINDFDKRWYAYQGGSKYLKWIMVISTEDLGIGKTYTPNKL